MKKRPKNLFLLGAASCLVGLLLLGFVAVDFYRADMRLVVRDTAASSLHQRDNQLGWMLKPGSTCRHVRPGDFDVVYTVDENGFRKTREAPSPALTITFFGDSYTFGHGVGDHETFPAVIAETYVKPEVRVRNAGVEGYGIVQMYQWFLNELDHVKPGDVVAFTPTASDIQRTIRDFVFPYACAFRRGENQDPIEYFPVYENGVVTSVALERTLWHKLKLLALTAPSTRGAWQRVFRVPSPDSTREAIEIVRDARARAEACGAKLILIFLPRISECLKQAYEVDVSGFALHDIMGDFPKDADALRRLRFNKDSHWNAEGHRVAAAAIVQALVEEACLDEVLLADSPRTAR